jgi:uncharacterized membrane protein YdjX (TVP38/TMEM64 family)
MRNPSLHSHQERPAPTPGLILVPSELRTNTTEVLTASRVDRGVLSTHTQAQAPTPAPISRQDAGGPETRAKMAKTDDTKSAKASVSPSSAPTDTDYQPINWKKIFFTPKYIPWHIVGIILIVITVLISVYHDQVVEALRPFSERLRDLPGGWIIPIVILFVISFPPLFGHEIVALLCGVVWGLWIGFAIVAAGTFIGEVGTWFAFKHLFRNRSMKMERTNLNYGALAQLTREGGFWIILVIRLSVIPSHFSTAVFSACDVKFWHFALSTFLALPKQVVLVYLGVLLIEGDTEEGESSTETTIQTAVFGATFVVTVIMGVYIYYKMRFYKKQLLAAQEIRRAAKGTVEMQDLPTTTEDDTRDEERQIGMTQNTEWGHSRGDNGRYNAYQNAYPYGGPDDQERYAGKAEDRGAYQGDKYDRRGVPTDEEDLGSMPPQQPARWL